MTIHNATHVLLCSFLFFSNNISPFDVKVLLQKFDNNAPGIQLTSKCGFVFSNHANLAIGHAYESPVVKISLKNEAICLNGSPIKGKILHIFPQICMQVKATLKSKISCWLENCKSDMIDMAHDLQPLFDDIVANDQAVCAQRYTVINDYVADVITDCVIALINKDDLDEIAQHRLYKHISDYVESKPQAMFVTLLSNQCLTSQYRKMLEMDKKKRYAFFNQQLQAVVAAIIFDCVFALSRTVLQEIVSAPIGMIEYDGNQYLGSFIVYQEKKQLYVINSLDINDYLHSVIKHEGFPGWSLEMNKVVAINCRTYLVWQILQALKLNRPYHIQNDNKHQTYKGYHQCAKLRQAVDETKDLIVAYQGNPACTMYDICCGGVVPGHIDDQGIKSRPYLARNYPCTFCKGYKAYSWSLDMAVQDILNTVKKEFPKIEKINDMHVAKRDKAGLVTKVMIMAGNRKILITGKKFKSLFPKIKSECFTINKAHKRYLIEGNGFGHHRGLCQWGANHLVKHEHWNFQEVLQFYYPGTTLMKLRYEV